MSEQTEWITLARVVRPQGRRGEVLADLFTDFPEQLHNACSLFSADGKRSPVRVDAHWLPTGRSAGRVVLKITGVDTIAQAEALAGHELQTPSDRRVALEQGTYYIRDLIGCTLLEAGTALGSVEDVQLALDSTGRRRNEAPPLFVLRRTDGDEVLIPFANEFVQRIDTDAKIIEMTLPRGLVELNG